MISLVNPKSINHFIEVKGSILIVPSLFENSNYLDNVSFTCQSLKAKYFKRELCLVCIEGVGGHYKTSLMLCSFKLNFVKETRE